MDFRPKVEPRIEALVGGVPSSRQVDEIELRSARRALKLLRQLISPEQMEALLASELDATDALWRGWAARSDGSWQPAEVEMLIEGITAGQFADWWATALDDLHGVVYPAFPEHYRFGWTADPRGGGEPCYLVIEELGHVPFRMYCSFDPSYAPVEPSPGFTPMMEGVGRLADGTEIVRFMNQIKDTERGMAMKVGVYMVSATPREVVESHIEQELVEWTRWLEMAHAAVHGSSPDTP